MTDYPAWICHPCGTRLGKPKGLYAAWHPDKCGWCGKDTSVTEPRDFCYPPAPKANQ